MAHRTLVTGFLAFEGFPVNPSALLAESSGRPCELLEVSFAAVDGFVDRLARSAESFDQLLMLGVRGRGTTIDLERIARNHIGANLDVRGVARGPGPIEPAAPETLATTLFDATATGAMSSSAVSSSTDAGCYLCNYLYYRALRRLPGKRVGFVHVPPLDVLPFEDQRRVLAGLIDRIEGRG
jgi:pyrrolidone-carboxylate peptidase